MAVYFTCFILVAATLGGKTVAADATMVPKLYWTPNLGDVYRANLDGTNRELIYPRPSGSRGAFVVDSREQQIYYPSLGNGFAKFDYDGQNAETMFELSGTVTTAAFDQANRQLYWKVFANDKQTLVRANLDGSELEVLADDLGRVDHIRVDPAGEYYYWTDNRVEGFHRDATDGSGGEIINYGDELGVTGFVPNVEDIAVDPVGSRLYIAEDAIDSILSIGLDGSDPQLLVTDEVVGPHAIAVDPVGERFYWSNSVPPPILDPSGEIVRPTTEFDHYVMSAKLDGSDVRKEFFFERLSAVPFKLAVVYVPVPEPEALALAALGGGAACAAKWRCACKTRSRCARSNNRPRRLTRFLSACFGR